MKVQLRLVITQTNLHHLIRLMTGYPVYRLMSRYFVCICTMSDCKTLIKTDNGGQFGRHLGFSNKYQVNLRGLLICYLHDLSGPFLKVSVYHQFLPGLGYCKLSWTVSARCRWSLLLVSDVISFFRFVPFER